MDKPIYLCYDEESDRIIITDQQIGQILFKAHNKIGYKHNEPKFCVPNTDFEIKIETNFGYASQSYLRCQMWYKKTKLLNFRKWYNCVSERIDIFTVEPKIDNWLQLFEIIALVYKNRESWNYDNAIKTLYQYSEIIDNISLVDFRIHHWSEKHIEYDDISKKLHITNKLCEIIHAMSEVNLTSFEQIKINLKSICNKLLIHTSSVYQDLIKLDKDSPSRERGIKILSKGVNIVYNHLMREQEYELIFSHIQ